MWYLMRIDLVAASSFAPYIMAAFFGILAAFAGLIATRIMVNAPKLLSRYLELPRNEAEVNSRKKWDNIWILIFVIVAAYLFYKCILPMFFSF